MSVLNRLNQSQIADILNHWSKQTTNNTSFVEVPDSLLSFIFLYYDPSVYITIYPAKYVTIETHDRSLIIYRTPQTLKLDERSEEDGLLYVDTTCDDGWTYGKNSFSVELVHKQGFNWAVGFLSKPEDPAMLKLCNPKFGAETGHTFFLNSYGYCGSYDDQGSLHSEIVLPKRESEALALAEEHFEDEDDEDEYPTDRILRGDKIVVTFDRENNSILYDINQGQIVHAQRDIPSDITLFFCGRQ